eukprot:scaffold8360_cov286-Pinguiococcus_pyrenoidosus.AAC.1
MARSPPRKKRRQPSPGNTACTTKAETDFAPASRSALPASKRVPPAFAVSAVDGHDPLVALPGLAAGDQRKALEHGAEALGRSIVRKGHAGDADFAEHGHDQGHRGAKRGDDAAAEVKAVLQRVHIVHHESRRPRGQGQVTQHPRIRAAGGHLPLHGDSLHGAHGVERQYHRETLHETLQKHDHDTQLTQRHVVVVEAAQ